MDSIHKKFPFKTVQYTIGPKGKTETQTQMEWWDWDANLEDSLNRKFTTPKKRVNNQENFKNIYVDAMEESDDECFNTKFSRRICPILVCSL